MRSNPSASVTEPTHVNSQNDGNTAGEGAVNPAVNPAVNRVPSDPDGIAYDGDLFTVSGTPAPEEQAPEAGTSVTLLPDPGIDRDEATRFLSEVFGDVKGVIEVAAFLEGSRKPEPVFRRLGEEITGHSGDTFLVTHDLLARAVEAGDKGITRGGEQKNIDAWYVRMTTLATEPERHSRGGASNIREFPGFWLDGDYAVDGHHKTDSVSQADGAVVLPPDAETVRRLWSQAGYPEPTITWMTGGGVNGAWLLHEPLTVEDGDEGRAVYQEIKAASKRWHERVRMVALAEGYHHDTTHNLDRLVRLPGSVNRKVSHHPKAVTAVYEGPRYTLDELMALIPEPERTEDGALVDPLTGMLLKEAPTHHAGTRGVSHGAPLEGLTPWDDFDARADWHSDVLNPLGWQHHGWAGQVEYLTRPGKEIRDGLSATLNHDGLDKLYIFSDTVERSHPSVKPYTQQYLTKSKVLCHMVHGGDWSALARDLRSRGYGDALPERAPRNAGQAHSDGQMPDGAADAHGEMAGEESVRAPKDPIPLQAPYPDPYDTACFGHLGTVAEAVSDNTETPTDMALMALLGCVSTALGGRVTTWVRTGHIEYATHYGITKAPPGKRKGAAQKYGRRPLEEWAKARVERDKIAVMQDASRRRVAEAYLKTVETKAGKTGAPGDLAEVDDALRRVADLGDPISDCVLFTENATPEALGDLMYEQGQRMAVISAESTFLSIIGGRYTKGQPNIDLVLKAFNQEAEEGVRIGRKMPPLTDPNLTLCVAVQDDAISHLGKASVMMDERGLWGRVHWCVPRDLAGIRQYDVPDIPQELTDDYDRRITALLDRVYDRDDTHEMRLSQGAVNAYRVFYSQTDTKLYDPIDRVPFYGWHDKAAGLVVRLATLVTLYEHALDDELPTEVPEHIFQAVASQLPVMMAHARKAASMMSLNEEDPREPARKVLQWISTRAQSRLLRVRDVLRALSSPRFPRLEPLMDALSVLEDNGWISFTMTPEGGVDQRTFWAHPAATPHLTDEAAREALVGATVDEEEIEERVDARKAAVTALAQALDPFVKRFCETGGDKTHRVAKAEMWEAWEAFSSQKADPQYFTEALRKVCPQVTEKRAGRAKVPTYIGIQLV